MVVPVGYFAWYNDNGKISYAKTCSDMWNTPKGSEGTNYLKARVIKSWPLTEDQFNCSLDELAKAFPCPKQE